MTKLAARLLIAAASLALPALANAQEPASTAAPVSASEAGAAATDRPGGGGGSAAEKTEISFGWRPSVRILRLTDRTDHSERFSNFAGNSWRLFARRPDLPIPKMALNFEMEYMEKDLTARSKGTPGGVGGHGFAWRLFLDRPIGLDDDELLRLSPRFGVMVNMLVGGYGSLADLPTRSEFGMLLGFQLERRFEKEDLNRVGVSFDAGLLSADIKSAKELGQMRHSSELRAQVYWSMKINDTLRFEARYIMTHTLADFVRARGLGNRQGSPTESIHWDELDNALCLSLVATF